MQNLQAATIQVGIDLGLFRCLAGLDGPMTVNQLSEKTGAAPQLTSESPDLPNSLARGSHQVQIASCDTSPP